MKQRPPKKMTKAEHIALAKRNHDAIQASVMNHGDIKTELLKILGQVSSFKDLDINDPRPAEALLAAKLTAKLIHGNVLALIAKLGEP